MTTGLAATLLEDLRVKNEQALELAVLSSAAVRIEQPLLRRLRLSFLPASDPAAEADLWFSPLVRARNALGIAFRPDVLRLLRERFAERRDRYFVRRAIRAMHAAQPRLLLLEEELIWLGLIGASETRINARLAQVVRAMTGDPRRIPDLSTWVVRALPNLPRAVQETPAAWILRNAAQMHLQISLPLDAEPPVGLPDTVIESLLPVPSLDVAIRLRRVENRIEVFPAGTDTGSALVVVRLPATSPLLLRVEEDGSPPRLLKIAANHLSSFAVTAPTVRFQNLRGERWVLQKRPQREAPPPVSGPRLPPPFRNQWVLVAGTAMRKGLPEAQQWAAIAIGEELARRGYGLIAGGFEGVDYLVAQSFIDELSQGSDEAERFSEERLLHVVGHDRDPDFPYAQVLRVDSIEDEYWEAAKRASAVVLIGGVEGTEPIAQHARRAGSWLFAFPGTGGVASQVQADNRYFDVRLDSFQRTRSVAQELTKEIDRYVVRDADIARWPPQICTELALDYLRPGNRNPYPPHLEGLESLIARIDTRDDELKAAFKSRIPAERVVAYSAMSMAVRVHLATELSAALVREARWSATFAETRPLWMALRAMSSIIKHVLGEDDDAQSAVHAGLAGVSRILKTAPNIDRNNECKLLARQLGLVLQAPGPDTEEPLSTPDSPVDFLLLTPRAEVAKALLSYVERPRQVREYGQSGVTYYRAEIPTASGDGSYQIAVRSSSGTEPFGTIFRSIALLQPRYVVFVGSAESRASEVVLGDVLIAAKIVAASAGKTRASYEYTSYDADRVLLAAAHDLRGWESELRRDPGTSQPRVHFGTVASSASWRLWEQLNRDWPGLIGLDAEAAMVIHGTRVGLYDTGVLTVHGVSQHLSQTLYAENTDSPPRNTWEAAVAFTIALLKSSPVPLSEPWIRAGISAGQRTPNSK